MLLDKNFHVYVDSPYGSHVFPTWDSCGRVDWVVGFQMPFLTKFGDFYFTLIAVVSSILNW